MIPPLIKFVFWIFVFIIVITFIIRLKKDMKLCNICGKRMWLWEEVCFKVEKVPMFTITREINVPECHARCRDGR